MATVPTSGTNIRLLSGIPFTNDNKNTRWFDDQTSQTNYFYGKTPVYQMTQANFQRIEGFNFIAVDQSIDTLWATNYLMFQNTSYNSKWFYGFVTKLEYVQRNRTNVYFEIDVIQSWMFDINFKPSYVVREHTDQFNTDGTPVTHHQDEGLDYGDEYDVVDVQQFIPYNDIFFMVIVAKQPLHTDSNYGITKGKISTRYNGVPTPLVYYAHPFRFQSGNEVVTLADGTTTSNLTDVLTALYTNTSSVDDIVSLYITDYLGFNVLNSSNQVDLTNNYLVKATITGDNSSSYTTLYYAGDISYSSIVKDMGSKYDGFNSVTEAKLMMFPYCVISLEDFKGNRIDLKPEYIYDSNLKITVRGGMGTENKTAYTVDQYNTDGLTSSIQKIASIDHGLINTNPNDVPILSDYLSAYLQGNKNTIQNQKQTLYMNTAIDGIGGAIGVGASIASGNVSGALSSVTGTAKGVGNDLMAIQGIQAKIKDISNHPPTLAKLGSNSAFDFGNGYQGIYIVKRQVKKEYRDKLTDFFNMFGYKSNHVKTPNLHTRQNWNYVQTMGCNIIGNFNNQDLQEIKQVFDNGVTLWHTDDVGNYDLTNGVI